MTDTIIILWYLTVNVIAFTLMGIDKYKAKHNKWRIPEATLITFAYTGGFIGAFVGMFTFRHKTRKWYFYVNFTLAAIIHTAMIVAYALYRIG